MSNEDIQEFRRNFTEIYKNKICPGLDQLEQYRLKEYDKLKSTITKILAVTISITILFSVIFLVCNPIYFIFHFLTIVPIIIIVIIIIPLAYRYNQKKIFEKKIKARIMPILMPAFGDLQWVNSEVISIQEIRNNKLIYMPTLENIEKKDDDCFIGSYKDTLFKISETTLCYRDSKKKGGSFYGLFILINLPKEFNGHTLILDKMLSMITTTPAQYPEVKLEDTEFMKKYDVISTNQIEARYILTPAFIEKFKNIKKIYRGMTISGSFLNNKLLLAIGNQHDAYTIGSIDKPFTDTKQFEIMLDEICTIYELIEELKLYDNTGF
ncbi:DUF3137 domain-containing protein [bacterium]|nr:DUF3137 domain-containing protein [bacterium]